MPALIVCHCFVQRDVQHGVILWLEVAVLIFRIRCRNHCLISLHLRHQSLFLTIFSIITLLVLVFGIIQLTSTHGP